MVSGWKLIKDSFTLRSKVFAPLEIFTPFKRYLDFFIIFYTTKTCMCLQSLSNLVKGQGNSNISPTVINVHSVRGLGDILEKMCYLKLKGIN